VLVIDRFVLWKRDQPNAAAADALPAAFRLD
jgi:hypothetical protein